MGCRVSTKVTMKNSQHVVPVTRPWCAGIIFFLAHNSLALRIRSKPSLRYWRDSFAYLQHTRGEKKLIFLYHRRISHRGFGRRRRWTGQGARTVPTSRGEEKGSQIYDMIAVTLSKQHYPSLTYRALLHSIITSPPANFPHVSLAFAIFKRGVLQWILRKILGQ